MGADIHCYIEYRPKDDPPAEWRSFGGRINPGRIYGIFGRLAGVRCEGQMIPARGIPGDLSWSASGDYWEFIGDEGGIDCVTTADAERYLKYGSVFRDADKKWISYPDWHSASWCSPEEWKSATIALPPEFEFPSEYVQYRAMHAAMKALEDGGANEVRVVFWFDN